MQTQLADFIKNTPKGIEADSILRRCVHCGFCTATCPTYRLLGDELDSPRGRIYLIKQMLEGEPITRKTQLHLDRCLTCRTCENTCPSGVQYARLLDIGRHLVEQKVARPFWDKIQRAMLRWVLPYPRRFNTLLGLGRVARPLLPSRLKKQIPARIHYATPLMMQRTRTVLLLDGCVQSGLAPHFNQATTAVLARLGITTVSVKQARCCGAVSYHLNAEEEAKATIRQTIDAWWPQVEQGVEAIVMTASGCGAMVKEYHYVLRDDPLYAEKAAKISALTKDLSEIITLNDAKKLGEMGRGHSPVAFHPPCTLQHGQRLYGQVESILKQLGFQLVPVTDSYLCCGSAGTYSILQPELSQQLLANRIAALEANHPSCIVTANIGCWHHLASASHLPVKHWIELLLPQNGGQ
ncbi:glycolate oxidase subunit GlcF [Thioflexithrix psekupsensis]|uniref:Glycolate oxidase iron-sulfur subunit n=1 Tax=Thioflexithrix psekupsensis TaxID=1570016 RepID=A0A251X4T8_9GAMM|nr:glycolate oxidase subunit GlcF [Thioflexithrix psekupsensis]OUD12162.1 glycolate oxidase iron-sulfur subunit [Thioflexithrix psekupsensis]